MDKMPDKHVLQKRSRKHDNKLHIETCCDFFIKYLYMKGSSKKQRVSFLGRFLLRNGKMLVYGLKNRGRLIHGIDLYSGKYGNYLPQVIKQNVAGRNFNDDYKYTSIYLTSDCNRPFARNILDIKFS